jgi:hypothetical protein
MWQHYNHENDYLQAKKGQRAYGMGIGVLLLDEDFPGFPGDLRNPSAYPFPIQYEVVEKVDMPLLNHGGHQSEFLPYKMRKKINDNLGKY